MKLLIYFKFFRTMTLSIYIECIYIYPTIKECPCYEIVLLGNVNSGKEVLSGSTRTEKHLGGSKPNAILFKLCYEIQLRVQMISFSYLAKN